MTCFAAAHRCLAIAALGALGLSAAACKQGDPAKCQQAVDTIRQALKSGDMKSADSWRGYAYKECSDTSQLGALDQEIVAKQAELQKHKAEEEAKKTQSQELMGIFVGWAADHKTAPDTAGNTVICDPEEKVDPPPPPGSKDKPHRWCTRTRSVGSSYTLTARYRDEDNAVIRFSTVAQAPVTCDALGPNHVLGTPPGRIYCEITGGRLQGMQALISNRPDGTHVDVFSTTYLQKDPSMAAYVH